MKNRNTYLTLLIIFALICVYNLYFTYERLSLDSQLNSLSPKQRAEWLANNENAEWYRDVVKNSMGLGLDLQGGMFVTMEIGVDDVLRALASNTDATFDRALLAARKASLSQNANFVDLFYAELKKLNANKKLSSYFYGKKTGLGFNDSDEAYLVKLKEESGVVVDNTLTVLRQRVDQFGVASPNIQAVGNGRIIVELPGVKDSKRVQQILRKTARLEFWETFTFNEVRDVLYGSVALKVRDLEKTGKSPKDSLDALPVAAQPDTLAQQPAADSAGAADTLADGTTESDSAKLAQSNPFAAALLPPARGGENTALVGYASAADTAKVMGWLRTPEVKRLLSDRLRLLWGAKPVPDEGDAQFASYVGKYALYAVKITPDGTPKLDGERVVNTSAGTDQQSRQIAVFMDMDTEGSRIWSKMTGENIGKSVAVVLDNQVYSAPTVQDKISGGSTRITGGFTLEEAQDLANILKAGKLPAPTRIEGEEIVGPTLGAETVNQGLISFLLGLLATLIFMQLYYRKAGTIAIVALLANLFLSLGVMSALGVVLTLPGIAGIVLSLAMAVDSNVLVYERVREELAQGKSIRGAIDGGFKNAFSAIIDGNLTTFITGVILYSFGTGPIRGFAVTLMIGIVITLVSALLVTRMLLEWQANRQGPAMANWSFGRNALARAFDRANFPFIARRRAWYGIIAVLVVVSFGSFFGQGFKMSVDFEGGRQYDIQFTGAVPPVEDVAQTLKANFGGNTPIVRTIGATQKLQVTTNYLASENSEQADAEVKSALLAGLRSFGIKGEDAIVRSDKVGPTIARDIKDSALNSVIFSLLAIFFYVFARFQGWQYGLAALLSLAFNVMLVMGIFSLLSAVAGLPFSVEIDQAFIAAILTIVGYTINDTVVVFDRIREEVRDDKAGIDLKLLFNKAINNTLSRTLVTSPTTVISAFIMLVLGGDSIKGFMFAMIIGIIIGTFSSIFLASPAALDLGGRSKRKPAVKAGLAKA